jgi:membrane protein
VVINRRDYKDIVLSFHQIKRKLSLFFKENLWEDEKLTSKNQFIQRLLSPLRVAVMVSKGFIRHECFARATALTYSSLLGMLPLLVVVFAVLSFFAAEHAPAIEKYLQNFFSPTSSISVNNGLDNEKTTHFVKGIMSFVKGVKTKQITIVGFIFLILFSTSLISKIEYSFNRIWGIKRGRGLIRKIGSYSLILLISPFIIAICLALSTSYQDFAMNKTSEIESFLAGFTGQFYIIDLMITISSFAVHNLGFAFSHLLQFLFAWFLFAVLYFYLPYTKVKISNSLKGGLITAVLFELSKPIFTGYVKYFFASTQISKIYGALSFLPVTVLWIYTVWVIVLLGAELTYSFQNLKSYQSEIALKQMSRKAKDLLILKIIKDILIHHQINHFFTIEEIANRFHLPYYFVDESMSILKEGGIVEENRDTGRIKILNENIKPGQVIIGLSCTGKKIKTEFSESSIELEKIMNDWDSVYLESEATFDV